MSRYIDIMGVKYKILISSEKEDPILEGNFGYHDPSIKRIVISDMKTLAKDLDSFADLDVYRDKVLRHEIIHAMLYESGLYDQSDFAMNEELIDWIALQFHKLRKIFEEVEA